MPRHATDQEKVTMKKYYQKNKEKIKELDKAYRKRNKSELQEKKRAYYQANKHLWKKVSYTDEYRDKAVKRNAKLRQQIIEIYGNKCACCGESELDFLAIDHINGDGNEHRKTFKGSIYLWLKKYNYPKKSFRVLCHNCNMATRFNKICPHKRKEV